MDIEIYIPYKEYKMFYLVALKTNSHFFMIFIHFGGLNTRIWHFIRTLMLSNCQWPTLLRVFFFLFYDEHNFLAPQNINVVNKLSMLIDIYFWSGGGWKRYARTKKINYSIQSFIKCHISGLLAVGTILIKTNNHWSVFNTFS